MNIIKLDRPFLVGEKIYLRGIDLNDVNEEYLNWVNDAEVINNLATVLPSTKIDLENFVKSNLENPNYVFFAIIEKKTNKHIGNIKLGPINWISRTSNYGLMIGDKDSWGKGFAQESFSLLNKFAFEKLNMHKLWDIAASTAIASIKANQKIGFKIEAELEDHVFKNGKYINVVVLSLFAKDYYKMNEK